MIEYLKTLPEWLEAALWVSIIIVLSGLGIGLVYRLVRYGVKVKAGVVEVDASEENDVQKS